MSTSKDTEWLAGVRSSQSHCYNGSLGARRRPSTTSRSCPSICEQCSGTSMTQKRELGGASRHPTRNNSRWNPEHVHHVLKTHIPIPFKVVWKPDSQFNETLLPTKPLDRPQHAVRATTARRVEFARRSGNLITDAEA